MKCPNCHLEIPEEAKFCPKCGFSIKGWVARANVKQIISPNINISPDIRVEGGGKVEVSPKISLSYYLDYSNEELVEKIKQLKLEYEKSLKERDITRSRLFCCELVELSAMLRDYSEVLKYLSVLRDYAEEEERKEIDSLLKELEFRVEKEMEFSDELVERIRVLVYRVKMGRK